MKLRTVAICIVVALCATPLFAASETARLEVQNELKIANVTLAPGDYTISWTGEGDKVNVVITDSDKNEVVKTDAKLVQLDKKARENVMFTRADGSVAELRFARKTASLIF